MSDRKRAFPFRTRQAVNYKDEPSDFDDSFDDPNKVPPKKAKSKDSDFEVTTGEDKSGSSSPSDSDDNDDGKDSGRGKDSANAAPWENPKLSEYERMILKNIEARNQFMREMGFPEAVRDLNVCLPTEAPKITVNPVKKPRAKNEKKESPLPPPREPSRRIRQLAAKNDEEVKKEAEEGEEDGKENSELVDNRLLDSAEMRGDMNDIMNNLTDAEYNPNLNLAECSIVEYRVQLRSLQLLSAHKVTPSRISSTLIHPSTSKIILFAGDKYGNFGIWAPLEGELEPRNMPIHRAPLNCMSVSKENHSTVYTTGHDGAVVQVDFSTGKYTNIFATDWSDRVRHLTWHDEFENHKLLVAHGVGEVGILDVRAGKEMQKWINCFPKSVRTVQHHPVHGNYFVASSSTGSFKIFDLRKSTECVCYEEHPKGLSSAFFSPGGTRIVSTCNDDYVRVFDSSTISSNLEKTATYAHNNFTGRWLTPFRANWVPQRDDVFHVGSLLKPRRMQFYKADNGGILCDVVHEEVSTVCCVISMHPALPIFAGANSSGKVHVFGPSDLENKAAP